VDGEGGMVKGVFICLQKLSVLNKCGLEHRNEKKKTDSVRGHLLMLLSLFGFILHLIGKAKELNASGFEFKI
jgi:hypothetical protein